MMPSFVSMGIGKRYRLLSLYIRGMDQQKLANIDCVFRRNLNFPFNFFAINHGAVQTVMIGDEVLSGFQLQGGVLAGNGVIVD